VLVLVSIMSLVSISSFCNSLHVHLGAVVVIPVAVIAVSDVPLLFLVLSHLVELFFTLSWADGSCGL